MYFLNKMQQQAEDVPPPMIKCSLPEYKDEHVWSFILQYLKSAGFQHTASAFCLELKGCRGVSEDSLQAISEVGSVDITFAWCRDPAVAFGISTTLCPHLPALLQDELRAHFACLLLRHLAGPTATAAIHVGSGLAGEH